jgi:hypothetical protein
MARLPLAKLGLGLLLLLAAAATTATTTATQTPFGDNKPVQLLAPIDAERTALKPVEAGLQALESLQVRVCFFLRFFGPRARSVCRGGRC